MRETHSRNEPSTWRQEILECTQPVCQGSEHHMEDVSEESRRQNTAQRVHSSSIHACSVQWKRSCITAWAWAWASASAYACSSNTDGVQAASESDGEDVATQDDGVNTNSNGGSFVAPGTLSGAVSGGGSSATHGGVSSAAPGDVPSAMPGGVSGAAPGGVSSVTPERVSGEARGGVSGNAEAAKLQKKASLISIAFIIAIAVGAAFVLCMILSLVIWKCRSSGARRRRNNTQGNADGRAPDIPYPESVARHNVCDHFGTPRVSGAGGGHLSLYGYQCAPLASLP
jgi:hypothetical protein